MKFKVGDRVKCIDASNSYLEYGKVYEVLGTSNDCQCIQVTGDCHVVWSTSRFELVKEEVSMHKFKVGDVVKITGSEDDNHKKWNNTDGFNNIWVNFMDKFIGKVCTVKGITKTGIDLTECNDYRFPPQALELYTEEMKIQKDKKYCTVEGKHPVRIVYADVIGARRYVILCEISGKEWIAQVNEYGEYLGCRVIEEVPEVDWSEITVNTPIWIGNLNGEYDPRHFAEFKNDSVYFYGAGRSSHTSNGVCAVSKSFAALTNPNEKT